MRSRSPSHGRPVKIAMLCQPADRLRLDGDDRSSVAILTRRFAHALARHHEVMLLARREPDQPAEERDRAGVRVLRLRAPGRGWSEALLRVSGAVTPGHPYFASSRYHAGYFRAAARVLRRESPDVVHFHSLPQHGARLRDALPRARLVLQMHGDALTQLDREVAFGQLRRIDRVLGVSDFITRGLAERLPELATRFATLHLGVDLEDFRPRAEHEATRSVKRLLYVGRISPEKGLHVLLAAFEVLLDAVPDAELELIGSEGLLPYAYLATSGDQRPPRSLGRYYGKDLAERVRLQLLPRRGYLDALLARMRPEAARRVRWRGAVPGPEVCQAYRRADVFVFPSLWNEAFGMPVLQAMASGVPAVVTRSGPLPELVGEGACGSVVPRDDPSALAGALTALLTDGEQARRKGAEGRRRAEAEFSWAALADQLERHYATPRDA